MQYGKGGIKKQSLEDQRAIEIELDCKSWCQHGLSRGSVTILETGDTHQKTDIHMGVSIESIPE